MKLLKLKPALLVVFSFLISLNSYGQIDFGETNSLDVFETKATSIQDFNLDDLEGTFNPNPLEGEVVTVDYIEQQNAQQVVAFVRTMLALGAGFGFVEDETLWCLHAAYYLRLAQFQRSAFYGAIGFAYSGFDNNGISQNIIDFNLRFLMFQSISKLNEIRLIYGLLFSYGFGNDKFDGFKTDITRFVAAAVIGFQLMLSTRWSLAIQTNLLAYQSTTRKPEGGGEFKDDFTSLLINKNNLLTLSLFFHLGRNSRN